jgi:uncharacterized damage-inducible protein DinB
MTVYAVLVDDNFTYTDPSERHQYGTFDAYEAAEAACRRVVDAFLAQGYRRGMSANALYRAYVSLGEDPFIVPDAPDGARFSAWGYAKQRCRELCRGSAPEASAHDCGNLLAGRGPATDAGLLMPCAAQWRSMQLEMLRTLYEYNRWATERLLGASERLTPQQWLAPGTAGRGSVRDTLVHLVSTQRGWLAWWDGSLPPLEAYARTLNPADFPDVATVRAAWQGVERSTTAFLDRLTDEDAQRVYSMDLPNGAVFRLALWKMMSHVANHGTQHRSEVAAMLTGYGQSPGNLDLLDFFEPLRSGQAG